MKLKLASLLFLCLTSCATVPSSIESKKITLYKPKLSQNELERHEAILGKWIGEVALKEGGVGKWLVHHKANGTYLVSFVIQITGKPEERIRELGYWGMSGDIYFTIMKGEVTQNGIMPSDPTNPFYYDAYKVLSLDKKQFVYESIPPGRSFTARKVPDSFSENDL